MSIAGAEGEVRSRSFQSLGGGWLIYLDGEQTDGEFLLAEVVVPAGHMPPLHVHHRESQSWLVLEGELTVYLPGKSMVLRPGQAAHGPRGVPHTHRVTSEAPARFLEVDCPAGFERFVAAAGEPTEGLAVPSPTTAPERAITVAGEYGVEILGPPGTLPATPPNAPLAAVGLT
jgi:mannose-6-phosphate isomerase-like protein (cupin superfamily)